MSRWIPVAELNSKPGATMAGTLSLAMMFILWQMTARTGLGQDAGAAPRNNPALAKADVRTTPQAGKEGDSAPQTIDDALQFARRHRSALDAVKDYTALFTKTELVGKKVIRQTMEIKCRHEPFSVYLHNRSGKEEGREVLYATGANDGLLLVHERGLLASLAGPQKLKLDDPLVMDENRYPITDIGIAKIIDKSIAIWEGEKRTDAKNVEVRFVSNVPVESVPCEMVEVVRKQQKPGFNYSLTRVYCAADSKLPIRAEQYGWPERPGEKPPLLEEYNYSDLKVNVGLSDTDFSPRNPMYGFGGAPSK
ncbi:MAG TPA: DUF1571 domain-containing protein [Planctomycetaceae bacterium]|jgi:hypothetical protein|nr:DUF1571 domain-containing protein [Planctomycetaceae bacterium]